MSYILYFYILNKNLVSMHILKVINKTLAIGWLIFCISCKTKENNTIKVEFESVKNIMETQEFVELEFYEGKTQQYLAKEFINTSLKNEATRIFFSKRKTGPIYNDVAIKNEKEILLIGGFGTGSAIKITHDGGASWKDFYENERGHLYDAVYNDSFYAIGDSPFIYKSKDGEEWSVYDTRKLKGIEDDFPTYYKINFFDKNHGLIAGVSKTEAILLKTENGGKHWDKVIMNFPEERSYGISNFKMLSKKEFMVVTLAGNCYHTMDGGKQWKQLYKGNKSLYSITFKDRKNGIIGGTGDVLLETKDGGKNWITIDKCYIGTSIEFPEIRSYKSGVLFIRSRAYNKNEIWPLLYYYDGKECVPFFTNNNDDITFEGDAYGFKIVNDSLLYIIDGKALYKLKN